MTVEATKKAEKNQVGVFLEKRLAKLQKEDLDNFERLLYRLTLRIESQENQRNLDPGIIRELRSFKETIESKWWR